LWPFFARPSEAVDDRRRCPESLRRLRWPLWSSVADRSRPPPSPPPPSLPSPASPPSARGSALPRLRRCRVCGFPMAGSDGLSVITRADTSQHDNGEKNEWSLRPLTLTEKKEKSSFSLWFLVNFLYPFVLSFCSFLSRFSSLFPFFLSSLPFRRARQVPLLE
jgi:hypothetical protein